MDFLQLCQRLRQETGIADSGPSSVTGQQGDMKRIVDWVNDTWDQLQTMHNNWSWMWGENTLAITAGNAEYAEPTDLRELVKDALYLIDGSSETRITLISYEDYRAKYRTLASGRPTEMAIKPNGRVVFNASPDQGYTLSYEYWKKPAPLVNGIDAPSLPERYHMVIVWLALMEYAVFDEAPELFQKGKSNSKRLLAGLKRETLPKLKKARPLA